MKSRIVVGLQWGDEGKGKIIDFLAASYEYVVRWNGGNNAGHTVVVGGRRFPLSLVPSGALQGKKLLIAHGVVINPSVLLAEIAMLEKAGYAIDLTIDPRCHIVMPYHQALDRAHELWKGKDATGSLHLGIGYCYEDRNNRSGIRLEFLTRPLLLKQMLEKIVPLKTSLIENVYGETAHFTGEAIWKEYCAYGRKLRRYIGDVARLVDKELGKRSFIFEQAHGTMLDPVFGTYPYTVAPPTIASAVFPMIGVPASDSVDVMGVVKAYTTRVGNGPFPTEIHEQIGEHIRQAGNEYGTVSKRPRRCGWLDMPMLRYAARLNGASSLAVTKLDVLTGMKSIRVCTGYRFGRTMLSEFPAEISRLASCEPVYDTVAGWSQDIGSVRRYRALPEEARRYISYLEKHIGVPVCYVSVGADRTAIIRKV